MSPNISQLATVRITCNGDTGTAVLFFPGENVEDVYVFTARHCLNGKKFDKEFKKTDIVLDKILNAREGTYHSYTLTETDVVITSEKIQDLALMILPKDRIIKLTGDAFYCQVADTDHAMTDYETRGFASFNDQQTDRPFMLRFVEDQKDNTSLFTMRSEQTLDTYYQQAHENVEGLSGCGAFGIANQNRYLTGIVHSYEDANLFTATKIIAYNQLIPIGKYKMISPIKPETNEAVLKTFTEMENNLEAASSRAKDTIANVNVPREKKTLLGMIKSSRLTVIHGKPGVGKSALAKAIVTDLKKNWDTTIITFSAEQLYTKTLNKALEKAGYSVSIDQIIGSPLSGKRVLVWIESFEKLIESGYDGAFNELLGLTKKHPQLSVVITLRDYLLQKFKIVYQFELPENSAYYAVSEFNDDEIAEVSKAIPDLVPLLENHKVNHLLRTPYYLDKAARIIPELLKEAQLDEQNFKKLMWQHIIEVGNTQRGVAFSAICLKRAREMSLFTTSAQPENVIQDLVRDNLLQVENSELGDRYSPSHDILEDWALVRFIKQLQRDATDSKDFLLKLETSPAIRRAFRLWLDEFYKHEPEASASFVHALIMAPDVAQTWKDELLIATLRSNHARPLFSALKSQLLLNDGVFLRHIIRLLETSCKTIDPKGKNFEELLPIGSGWDFIIEFIKENLSAINDFRAFEFQYLSVIESWSKQLPDYNVLSLPPAAASAAFLLKEFIQKYQAQVGGYRMRKLDNSFLNSYASILFKLTSAAPELVRDLLQAALSPEVPHAIWTDAGTLEAVREYMIGGVISDQFCKYFPNEVIRVASENWCAKEELRRPGSLMDMIQVRPDVNDFGLYKHINQRYGFPSGYQTFFYWLFLHHPNKALDFLIPFLNKAFQKNKQVLTALGEELEEITLQFPDGTTQTYFGNFEYWTMYRGGYSRNRLVTSLLMALETGLLDLADQGEHQYPVVRRYLNLLIKKSNSVAALGLVSSIIQAHPLLLDEVSVPIFGVAIFYRWDASRSSDEMLSMDTYNDDQFEKKERIISNQRPHRRRYYQGMVGFVADYMFYHGNQNELLFKEVDDMWADAAGKDMIWKKFLFDMDARKYNFQPVTQPGYENMVQLVPGYDLEVQKTILSRDDAASFVPSGNSLWAKKVFDNEDLPDRNYATWKNGYDFIQSLKGKNNFMTAPGTMATIGLRDFFEQLQPDELTWCREELISHGEKQLQTKDNFNFSLNIMDENPSMFGLSYIFKNQPDEFTDQRTKETIFRLLLSGMDEQKRIYLEAGIARQLSKFQPSFVTNCWYGLLAFIDYKKTSNLAERDLYDDYYSIGDVELMEPPNNKAIEKSWIDGLVKSVVNGTIPIPDRITATLDMATHWFQDDALRIIPTDTSLSDQHGFIQQLLELHLSFLDDSDQRYKSEFYDSRHAFTFFYARYLLNQPQDHAKQLFKGLLDRILISSGNVHSEEFDKFLYDLVKENIRAVNNGEPLQNFWCLWEYLCEWIIEHKNGTFMPLFLMDLDWTENSEGWHVLEGRNLFYKNFIVEWGFNLINTSIKFVSGIAFNKFMPDAVSWVAGMLKSQNANEVELKIAGKFIEKCFYKYGAQIKANRVLLTDYLFILDFLIGKGSSKAYMLREDLIQYK